MVVVVLLLATRTWCDAHGVGFGGRGSLVFGVCFGRTDDVGRLNQW